MRLIHKTGTMKKTILLLLPLLLTTACSHTKIIERPEIALNSSTNYLSLERVVCTPEATRLDLTVCCIPGKGFSIEKEAYLQSRESGLKYVLTGAEGIEPGKKIKTDSTGLVDISLLFEPIPTDEKQIDFIESEDWQLFGIDLSKKKKPVQIECLIEGTVINRPQSSAILLNTSEKVFDRHTKGNIVIPIRNGKFSYLLRTDTCTTYGLCFNDEWVNGCMLNKIFFAEPGSIYLTIEGDDSVHIEGGKLTEEYQNIQKYGRDRLQPIYDKRDSLYDIEKLYTPEVYALFKEMDNCNDPTQRGLLGEKFQNLRVEGKAYSREGNALQKEAEQTHAEIEKWELDRIAGQPSLATYYLLFEKIKRAVVYSRQTIPDSIIEIYRTLYKPIYPDHPFTRDIEQYIKAQQSFVGGKYIDIVLPDTTGTTYRLSDLIQGCKIALIDFWSIHCGPCRRTSKAMIPVYEKYKDKGFRIVGISRDGRQQMTRGIHHDGYPWINLIDEYNKNQVFKSYGIENTAGYTFLVDGNGTIVASGASVEEMISLIEKYCK